MVWSQVEHEVTTPHVAYAVTGFALILFGTISLFIKERLYLGEASLATIYGLIVGPHCLNWFTPTKWGNTDYITLEISRIVLIVQIFAVAVELPKRYMLKHWWSVSMLLLPVMAFGWLITSVFIWKLVPTLRWIHALCISGCVTATDPVLASAVVGKGKFARRVPGHLRNLLSAESGCNDGMAFPFVIMAVDIILDEHHPAEIAKDFICIGVLYECVLGILIGITIGYGARHLIKFAEKMSLIDRESFLAYYFCVAMFCAGVGTLCGVDDLLVAFAAGCAFSWDGWFSKQTEESHVSNVIDTLINTAFFVYFGAIVPWPDFNNAELGIRAWKLVCLAIIVLVVRRVPIMLAIKPITPDIHTWREAFFCGHFGPIGVGAVFMALLARAQLENGTETPEKVLPEKGHANYYLVATIWPVTCFLVIASIIVHGSSIAVFTLGKRINNMAITLTYTTTTGDEPSWLSRLPRRNTDSRNMLQLQRMETEEPINRRFRRRRRLSLRPKASTDESISKAAERIPDNVGFDNEGKHAVRTEHPHPGPAVAGNRQGEDSPDKEDEQASSTLDLHLSVKLDNDDEPIELYDSVAAAKLEGKELSDINTYREGDHIVIEDKDGDVVHQFNIGDSGGEILGKPKLEIVAAGSRAPQASASSLSSFLPGSRDEVTDVEGTINSGSRSESSDELERTKGMPSRAHSSSLDLNRDSRTTTSSGQRPRRRSLPRMASTRSRLNMPRKGIHAYAYVIDDTVVVENEDGEILRRYKYVPRGGSTPGQRTPDSPNPSHGWGRFIPNFIQKRFSTKSPQTEPEKFTDLENAPNDMLIPDPDCPPLSTAASQSVSVDDEKHLRRSLSNMLRNGKIDRRPSRLSNDLALSPGERANTVRSQAIVSDNEDEDDVAVTDYDNEDEDAEPETSVERHRRLAALGIIDTGVENAVAEQNGDEDEPKITFKLPERPA